MSSGLDSAGDRNPGEIETDREALRVDLDPVAARGPIESAWLMGRLCNELRFRFQEAWLAFRDGEPERTSRLWGDLSMLLSDALPSTANSGPASAMLERARSDWEFAFQSAAHSDDLERVNALLRAHFDEGADLPGGQSAIDFLLQVTATAVEVITSFNAVLTSQLVEAQRWAWQLGQEADQIIHPPLSHRARHIRVGAEVGPSTWSDTSSPRPAWVLDRPLDVNESWPDGEWTRQVVFQHARLHFALGLDPPELFNQNTVLNTRAEVLDEIADRVRLVADVPFDVEGNGDDDNEHGRIAFTQQGERNRRRLGLSIDTSINQVSRRGAGSIVDLQPRQLLLLIHFLNQGDCCTPVEWFTQNWSRFSPRTSICQPSSVRSAVGDLNRELEEIQLEARGHAAGYRLDDLRNSSS